ncbi:MAG: HEPN domain-containing protein [Candidatus Woesearchaeota archaeon]
MDQIKWCLQQKKGIKFVEPNDNLRKAYLIKAEEALDTLRTSKSRDWQLTTAYYTIYHSIYSLLMKIGIKCEIHSCTIEFAKRFLTKYLSIEDFELIDKAFSARIDSQYYVNREIPNQNYDIIMKKTPAFLVKCKNILLEEEEIKYIIKQITSLR